MSRNIMNRYLLSQVSHLKLLEPPNSHDKGSSDTKKYGAIQSPLIFATTFFYIGLATAESHCESFLSVKAVSTHS